MVDVGVGRGHDEIPSQDRPIVPPLVEPNDLADSLDEGADVTNPRAAGLRRKTVRGAESTGRSARVRLVSLVLSTTKLGSSSVELTWSNPTAAHGKSLVPPAKPCGSRLAIHLCIASLLPQRGLMKHGSMKIPRPHQGSSRRPRMRMPG